MSTDPVVYEVIPITAAFTVQVVETPALSSADAHAVDAIWEVATQQNPSLFPGTILNGLSYTRDGLVGSWIPYPQAYAAAHTIKLAQRLNVRPVAVSGAVWAGRHVLLGRRSAHVTEYPGHLELAPSGGLDTVDYRKAILKELTEETGIASQEVAEIRPFAMMVPKEAGTIELCLVLTLHSLEPPPLQPKAKEYEQLFWVPIDRVRDLIANAHDLVVPLTQYLIKAWTS